MKKDLAIVWFRQDLRVDDNPAHIAASKAGTLLPIYIFDDCAPTPFKLGSLSKAWLHQSLLELDATLSGGLQLYVGSAEKIIAQLLKKYAVLGLFWNRCYEPWHLAQETAVQQLCEQFSVSCQVFNGNYLSQPTEVLKADGGYYKVFTAYKNKLRSLTPPKPLPAPRELNLVTDQSNKTQLADLKLMHKSAHTQSILQQWAIGEQAAQKKLDHFIKNRLDGYKLGRDYPAKAQTSLLSPHLHFGELSPAQVLATVNRRGHNYANSADIEHFISELVWREFSAYLLYYFPALPMENFNAKFDHFAWGNNRSWLQAWQHGKTGYPLVDAGLRELLQTGYMHNRVRMVVASFLIKNLNLHWRHGRDWFWEHLVDADLANNSASWQWVAGSGVDAAPYFRIFNPITQGEKFDRDGKYTKKFVPELKELPPKYLFKPWAAPAGVLQAAGVSLGESYPRPIVELATSRKQALARFKAL